MIDIFERLAESIKANRSAALVTVVYSEGSTPGKEGAMMAVWDDGTTSGTVGGGNLEYQAVKQAKESLRKGESREISFSLKETGELGMMCGGAVRIYIKVFGGKPKLLIVGGGHIGVELCKVACIAGFSVTVFDDREEFLGADRFPGAESVAGDIGESLKSYSVDENTYAAIATRGHASDKEALKALVGRGAAYVGMIGSRNKVNAIFEKLVDSGVEKVELDKVYAPMGLNIASVKPEEIAISIISEILLVKNSGTAEHMIKVK